MRNQVTWIQRTSSRTYVFLQLLKALFLSLFRYPTGCCTKSPSQTHRHSAPQDPVCANINTKNPNGTAEWWTAAIRYTREYQLFIARNRNVHRHSTAVLFSCQVFKLYYELFRIWIPTFRFPRSDQDLNKETQLASFAKNKHKGATDREVVLCKYF